MNGPLIAILSPTPDYEEDWSHIKADYIRLLGKDTVFADWTRASNLSQFDLVTPLLAWGYQRDCTFWFALLDQMETDGIVVANPISVLRWNSDKSYLAQLSAAGIATIPSIITNALEPATLDDARMKFQTETLVIKPPISGGADGTFKLDRTDSIPGSVFGKRMMVQPFISNITSQGELSLFYFGGTFSHSIIKRPAKGDFRVQEQFGGFEEAIDAPTSAKRLAEAALGMATKITQSGELAYARVDMLRGDDGNFMLMELELIEPSLFLRFAPDGGAAFAKSLLSKRGGMRQKAEP